MPKFRVSNRSDLVDLHFV